MGGGWGPVKGWAYGLGWAGGMVAQEGAGPSAGCQPRWVRLVSGGFWGFFRAVLQVELGGSVFEQDALGCKSNRDGVRLSGRELGCKSSWAGVGLSMRELGCRLPARQVG